jgi:UDP-N-acetylglucosamine 2-epimerase (non-hydrolysing)
MKVLLCFGTRPEAIKMAPLYHELKKAQDLKVTLCVTAQHRQMLDQVLSFFEIKPDYDLNLMKPNQTLNGVSSDILLEVDKVFLAEKPDVVLVHGDTTTSSMVALAAFHRGIKVGHIEAGLRTFNKHVPFPEEMNRQLTGKLADYHFAPTLLAQQNLEKEFVDKNNILVTGNTVIDALLWTKSKLESGYLTPQIQNLFSLKTKKIVLVTGHRRESFGQGYINFCEALIEISKEENVHIVFPVHLNPNVQEPVKRFLGKTENILLLEPVEYPVMVWLIQNCTFIISDSGGIQEEAPTFKKPILVTRDVSERPEGVEKGFSKLVGTKKHLIVESAKYLLENGFETQSKNPYGDGKASKRILDFLLNLNNKEKLLQAFKN